MADTGQNASQTLSVTGSTAAQGEEMDLQVDAAGDVLQVDSAGDTLMAIPGLGFTGQTAATSA